MKLRDGRRDIFAMLICLTVILGAVLLPPYIASATSGFMVGTVKIVAAEKTLTDRQTEMKVVEKLRLLELAQDADFIAIETGRSMDAGTAFEAIKTGVEDLMARGLMPKSEVDWDRRVGEPGAYFILKYDDPGKNIIVWVQQFVFDEGVGAVCVDDETGLVLEWSYYGDLSSISSLSTDDYFKAWGRCLGIDPVETYESIYGHDGGSYTLMLSQDGMSAKFSVVMSSDEIIFGGSSLVSWREAYSTREKSAVYEEYTTDKPIYIS